MADRGAAIVDHARRWRLGHVAMAYVVAIVLASVGAAMAVGAGADDDSVATYLGAQVAFWSVLVGAVVLARRTPGVATLRVAVRPSDVRSFLIGVATQVVLLPAIYLPIRWFVDQDVDDAARDLLDTGSTAATVVIVLGVVLIAPVVEELFFRGLLLGALRHRFSDRAAVVLSAALFGATHFQLLQLPGLFAAGVVFAWLVVRDRRLGGAIFAHAGFNAATVVVLLATN